jgi:peptidoglycan/LPS O-acetylase OafA/YrhL
MTARSTTFREAVPTSATAYIPAIDGLRALAILVVIASHLGADRFVPGGFGVTLFFFISGYLITSLMIQEHAATGGPISLHFIFGDSCDLAPPS